MKQITIDCAGIATSPEFHQVIAAAMDFPDYYGKNLDALMDCLTEIGEDMELVLLNWHKLECNLKDYSGRILSVFQCACQENSRLSVTIHP